jgi:hypothetical protein
MIYLPDTNALIRFLNPGQRPVTDHFLSVKETSGGTLLSIYLLCELEK